MEARARNEKDGSHAVWWTGGCTPHVLDQMACMMRHWKNAVAFGLMSSNNTSLMPSSCESARAVRNDTTNTDTRTHAHTHTQTHTHTRLARFAALACRYSGVAEPDWSAAATCSVKSAGCESTRQRALDSRYYRKIP